MSTSIDALNNLPDINFVEKDVDTLLSEMIAEYQDAYYKATGKTKTLASGDPIRIWIYAQALRIYTAYQLIDRAAKNNLLKYASGAYLEHLGAIIGVTRKGATAAEVNQEFSLVQSQNFTEDFNVMIPAGTQVSAGGDVFFATGNDIKLTVKQPKAAAIAKCTMAGTIGNDYVPGQLTTLVDPIPYIESTMNTTKSQGGADPEDDESLRERIFIKPESFSVAGPSGAYEYFVKDCDPTISDVKVIGGEGVVNVYYIHEDGTLAQDPIKTKVSDYLSADTRRPLTDQVRVQPPDTVEFSVDIDYYIKKSDQGSIQTIKNTVQAAVNDYVIWQRSKIGRDINPAKLVAMVMNAGASRVVVNSPVYTTIGETELAIATGDPVIKPHDAPEELEDE